MRIAQSALLLAFLAASTSTARIQPLKLIRKDDNNIVGLFGGLLGGGPIQNRDSSITFPKRIESLNLGVINNFGGLGGGLKREGGIGGSGKDKRQGTLPSPGDLPTSCQSVCAGPITTVNTCVPPQPSCLCSVEFQKALFDCYLCVGNNVSSTPNFATVQANIDGITTACDNAGVPLPLLTFPGQNSARTLSTTSVSGTKTGTFSVTGISPTSFSIASSISSTTTRSSSNSVSSSTLSAPSSTAPLITQSVQTVPSVLPSPTSGGAGVQTQGAGNGAVRMKMGMSVVWTGVVGVVGGLVLGAML